MIGFPLVMIALLSAAAAMGFVAVGWITLDSAEDFFRRAMTLYVFGLLAMFLEMFV